MFEHTLKYLEAEEAKLRGELRVQKGILKTERREQIQQQIEDVYRQRSLCFQSHERNLENFKEESSPRKFCRRFSPIPKARDQSYLPRCLPWELRQTNSDRLWGGETTRQVLRAFAVGPPRATFRGVLC